MVNACCCNANEIKGSEHPKKDDSPKVGGSTLKKRNGMEPARVMEVFIQPPPNVT